MSGSRLHKQCVATPDKTVLVTCYQQSNPAYGAGDIKLVGHVFATVWDYDGGNYSLTYIINFCSSYAF